MAVPLFDTSTPLAPIDAEIRAKVNEIIASKRFIFGPEVEAFEREFAAYIGTFGPRTGWVAGIVSGILGGAVVFLLLKEVDERRKRRRR